MEHVFPAIESRFDNDPQLKKLGRMLYHGAIEQVRSVREYVEVACESIAFDFETFDTDERVYTLNFQVYTKDRNSDRCARIMGCLIRAFKDANIVGAGFSTSASRFTSGAGPLLEDGVYRGSLTLNLHVTFDSMEPAVRHG